MLSTSIHFHPLVGELREKNVNKIISLDGQLLLPHRYYEKYTYGLSWKQQLGEVLAVKQPRPMVVGQSKVKLMAVGHQHNGLMVVGLTRIYKQMFKLYYCHRYKLEVIARNEMVVLYVLDSWLRATDKVNLWGWGSDELDLWLLLDQTDLWLLLDNTDLWLLLDNADLWLWDMDNLWLLWHLDDLWLAWPKVSN